MKVSCDVAIARSALIETGESVSAFVLGLIFFDFSAFVWCVGLGLEVLYWGLVFCTVLLSATLCDCDIKFNSVKRSPLYFLER